MDLRMGLRRLVAAGIAVAAAPPILVQAASEAIAFENSQYHYTVAMPPGCRYEEGPGTLDAVCAPDFDAVKSAVVSNATALVLGVAAEAMPADGDTTTAALQQRYGEAAFKEELPETVCGESDKARVKIDNLSEAMDGPRLVYTADVTCAPVKFLQIAERRAAVRYVIAPDARYRVVARAPAEDFDRQRAAIDAFLASFRVLPSERTEK
jgi:hypothetical protein